MNMERIKALLARALAEYRKTRDQFDRDIAAWQWKVNGIERRGTVRQPQPQGLTGGEILARLRELNEGLDAGTVDNRATGQAL
jgi:hypothetical protein